MPYLTGDTVPVTRKCRTIHVPSDPAFMAAVSGQLIELIYPETWEKFGTLTPAQMAAAFRDAYYEFADSECIELVDLKFPDQFNVNVLDAKLVAGTNLLRTANASQFGNFHVEISPFAAAGNEMSWGVFVRKGRYDVTLVGAHNNNYGDIDLKVDGVTVAAGQIGYAAAGANNILYVFDLPFLTDGQHVLTCHTFQKQAASAAYRFVVSQLYGRWRTVI